MDFFSEIIVKAKRLPLDWFKIFCTLAAGLFIIDIFIVFNGFIPSLLPLEIAGVVYGMYWLISSTSAEFEYAVTNDQLDVDKIIARKRRKKVLSVSIRKFEYLAPLTDEYADVFNDKSITKRIDASSRVMTDRHCFAIFYENGEKTCLIFEPTEDMLNHFKTLVPRSLNFTL